MVSLHWIDVQSSPLNRGATTLKHWVIDSVPMRLSKIFLCEYLCRFAPQEYDVGGRSLSLWVCYESKEENRKT